MAAVTELVVERLRAAGGDSFGLLVSSDLTYSALCARLVPVLADWESAVSADDAGYFEFTPPVLTPFGPAIGVGNLGHVDLALDHIAELFELAEIDARVSLLNEPQYGRWTYVGPADLLITRADLRAEPLAYEPGSGFAPLSVGQDPHAEDILAWALPADTRTAVARVLANWLRPDLGPVHLTAGAVHFTIPPSPPGALAAILASEFPGRPTPWYAFVETRGGFRRIFLDSQHPIAVAAVGHRPSEGDPTADLVLARAALQALAPHSVYGRIRGSSRPWHVEAPNDLGTANWAPERGARPIFLRTITQRGYLPDAFGIQLIGEDLLSRPNARHLDLGAWDVTAIGTSLLVQAKDLTGWLDPEPPSPELILPARRSMDALIWS